MWLFTKNNHWWSAVPTAGLVDIRRTHFGGKKIIFTSHYFLNLPHRFGHFAFGDIEDFTEASSNKINCLV